MAVGVVTVGLGVGEAIRNQTQQAGEAIGGAVHGIGQQGQRSTEQTDDQLQQGHAHVDPKGHQQHPLDLGSAVFAFAVLTGQTHGPGGSLRSFHAIGSGHGLIAELKSWRGRRIQAPL